MKTLARTFAVLLLLSSCGREPETPGLSETQLNVAAAVIEIDSMRSVLAASIGDEQVDFDTFARTCPPVGARMGEIAQSNGWEFRQLASKYRNPANAPDRLAAAIHSRFESDSSLDSLWLQVDDGLRYFRRITVEPSCLRCHGEKENRPQFVIEGYPEDRAFGFAPGDLRGVYSVLVPDSLARPAASDELMPG